MTTTNSDEPKPASRKIRRYETEGIVIAYEVARCIHAEECIHGLPKVFDPDARPWINAANEGASAIADVIHRCPTGALHYHRLDGGDEEDAPGVNRCQAVANGPLHVSGDLHLNLPGGEAMDAVRVALCRCGASKNKPYCDNSHREFDFEALGFDSSAAAVDSRLTGESSEKSRGSDFGADHQLVVKFAPNGPILIEGPVVVLSGTESLEEVEQRDKAALCRCGHSASKPFCDGSHKVVGFVAD